MRLLLGNILRSKFGYLGGDENDRCGQNSDFPGPIATEAALKRLTKTMTGKVLTLILNNTTGLHCNLQH